MADISIIKLKVRRGTDSQRQRIILEQGELGFTTDTQRLFVGNGILSGGVVAGNIIHPIQLVNGARINLSNAIKNDIVNENGFLYQLSGANYNQLSAWSFIGPKVNGTSIDYDVNRQLTIKTNGIGANSFNETATYNMGGLVANPTQGLSANIDRNTLTITSTNQLSVFKITQDQIQTSALGDGLTGGSGNLLRLNVGAGLGFNSGVLTLTGVPTNSVGISSISTDAIGSGLSLSAGKVVADLRTIDLSSFSLNDGQLQLISRSAATDKFSNTTFNDRGIRTGSTSTITQIFTGNETTASPLSVFNGYPSQTSYTNQTVLSALSGTNTIKLSSAGFIVIDTSSHGNLAIPVFKF